MGNTADSQRIEIEVHSGETPTPLIVRHLIEQEWPGYEVTNVQQGPERCPHGALKWTADVDLAASDV